MPHAERSLFRHLSIALLLKALVIATLWMLFFNTNDPPVDADRAAAHILQAGAASGEMP